jgi:hypothetical protein
MAMRGIILGVLAITACSAGDGGVAGPQGPPGAPALAAEAGSQGPPGIAGPSGDAGTRGAGAKWLDANGKEVTVVDYEPIGKYLYFFDAAGHVWLYRTDLEAVDVVYLDGGGARFYASSDCSGPVYKRVLTPNMTLDEGNGVAIIRPPTLAAKTFVYNSLNNFGSDGCSVESGPITGVLLSGFQNAGAKPVVASPLYPVP